MEGISIRDRLCLESRRVLIGLGFEYSAFRKMSRVVGILYHNGMKQHMTDNGTLTISCKFHVESVPSLRIFSDGTFTCYACGEDGHIDNDEDLKNVYIAMRAQLAERFGQLRLPGI